MPKAPQDAPDIQATTATLRREIADAWSEEDLRVAVELVLRKALPELPTPKYEKSIRTSTFYGRADAVHQGLVIEYEKPGSMRARGHVEQAVDQVCSYMVALGLKAAAQGRKRKDEGSFNKEESYSQEQEECLSAFVGLATDGETFVFVQRRSGRWHTDSREFDEDTIEQLIVWLRAMNRKDLSPENLIADFGPQTPLADEVVDVLARLVRSGKHVKANVIYAEWQRIFGIVYGTGQLERTGRQERASLTSAYRVEHDVDFPFLLFAVHTYYAFLMKVLVTEVIVASGGFGDSFIGGLARTRLREQLRDLESGEILLRHNIRNAIEQDFFGWYTEAWTSELQKVLWKMVSTLADYDISTFELKPDRARDLLKDLYHGLIPESVRHALGEYYTPDWLAEHTIELAGYDGDPNKTLLDPSCGSGTFLVLAIHKVRQWLSDRTIQWGSNEKRREALKLIRRNIVGFDLNPLAAIAARTNYMFALGPLLRYRGADDEFEVPVYLTDSVLLPGRMPDQKGLFTHDTIPFPMMVRTFDLPTQVVENRQVPDLMNLLHDAIVDGHSRDSFVNRSIAGLELPDNDRLRLPLATLFDAMLDLDKQGKNRVWTKLIRNRYASLFFHHYFDFVVGNPPHVNWESLTPDWRKAAEDEYRNYGLFTLKGFESRHGGGKKDIAALFTYAVMDHFVKDAGILALVVHVSLFKTSGAGEGFRRFQLGDGEHFCVEVAHDFASFQPFQTHPRMKIKTRTVTFRAVKGKKTKFPIAYDSWRKTASGFIPGWFTWSMANERLSHRRLVATPLRGTAKGGLLSPWLTIPSKQLPGARKIIAPPDYRPYYKAHAGLYTHGLNGAYFVEVLDRLPNGTAAIRNLHNVGKIRCPSVRATVEADLLYPLLRGRDVAKWRNRPEAHVLVVQDPETQRGFPEAWMQETHPLTWAYLTKFKKLLNKRKSFQKFRTDKDPFYGMYAVADYTFAPHKVVWMDVSATMKASVVSTSPDNEMPMPEHKLMLLTTDSNDEAHYVASVLNSGPFDAVVAGYIVDNSVSTHPIENLRIGVCT